MSDAPEAGVSDFESAKLEYALQSEFTRFVERDHAVTPRHAGDDVGALEADTRSNTVDGSVRYTTM